MSNLLILLPRIHPSFEIKFSKLIKISKHSFLCLSLLMFSYLVAYATRYENINKDKHKKECLEILINLENLISNEGWILGSKINKLDISILPFIRQFRIADIEWFDKQNKIKGVQKILFNFLDSNLFKEVMYKYDVWEENAEPQFFP